MQFRNEHELAMARLGSTLREAVNAVESDAGLIQLSMQHGWHA